jgi:hypothetical protein
MSATTPKHPMDQLLVPKGELLMKQLIGDVFWAIQEKYSANSSKGGPAHEKAVLKPGLPPMCPQQSNDWMSPAQFWMQQCNMLKKPCLIVDMIHIILTPVLGCINACQTIHAHMRAHSFADVTLPNLLLLLLLLLLLPNH